MTIYQSIRQSRKKSGLTQEQMAEKMGLSLTGYANLERGITKMSLDKLQQVATILNTDILELIQNGLDKGVVLLGANDGNHILCYGNTDVQQLQEIIKLKDEIIAHQQNEIDLLNRLIAKKQ